MLEENREIIERSWTVVINRDVDAVNVYLLPLSQFPYFR